MRSSIFVLLCVSKFSLLIASPYKACESKGNIVELAVRDCSDDVSRCVLERGKDAHIDLTFVVQKQVEKVKVKVFGVMGVLDHQMSVPYPISNPNACKDSNLTCPINEGQNVTYSQSFAVLLIYPRIELIVKWTLVDPSTDDVLVCAEIPVRIK
uniref:Niemann-Pick type C2-2 protein n=1 Tax=Neoseiulus barkeri TaxID=573039 RepID=A0A8F2F5T0_9ACAR|nr:Niemann-Pick type C2-2 protein [Neoseiulus barkeri]